MMTTCNIEEATRGQINARRNYLMGLWAGRLLGLRNSHLSDYVQDVMVSDYSEPGPGDVIRKLSDDFASAGVDIGKDQLLLQLRRTETSVRSELLSTD